MTTITDSLLNEIFEICSQASSNLSSPQPNNTKKEKSFKQLEAEFKKYIEFSYALCSKDNSDDIDISSICSETETSQKKSKWTDEHDKSLLHYVKSYKHDWKKICSRIQNLFGRKWRLSYLRRRYTFIKSGVQTLKPAVTFTKEEDCRLVNEVNEQGFNWDEISLNFYDRNAKSLKNRYYYLKRKNLLKSF